MIGKRVVSEPTEWLHWMSLMINLKNSTKTKKIHAFNVKKKIK